METVLLVVAIAAAGLVCPAMMWWQRRRGRDAACCMPAAQAQRDAGRDAPAGLAELRRRRADIEARLAEHERDASGATYRVGR